MKIVQLLRVKNGEPFIKDFMDFMSQIVDYFYILDDGSTDKTYEICINHGHGKIKHIETFNREFHGGRDRAQLYQWLIDSYKLLWDDNIWCTCLDHNEIFENKALRQFRDELESLDPEYRCVQYMAYTMWNNKDTYRNDGMWKPKAFIRAFRFNPNWKMDNTRKFHSIAVPLEALKKDPNKDYYTSNIRLKHFGYLYSEMRQRKYEFYTAGISMTTKVEIGADDYKHLIDETNMVLERWEEE